MSNVVKGAGRKKFAAQQAKHSQRASLPVKASAGRNIRAKHDADIKAAAERIVAPMAPASSKAGQFADKAEELGWTVERVRRADGGKTVTASRGDEAIVISWTVNETFVPDALWQPEKSVSARRVKNAAEAYRMLARSAEDAMAAATPRRVAGKHDAKLTQPRKSKVKLNFDPKTSSDAEVVDAVSGHRITWYNSMTEDFEESHVPAKGATRSKRINGEIVQMPVNYATHITDTRTEGAPRRILNWCDPHSGFRACYVDAIQTIS